MKKIIFSMVFILSQSCVFAGIFAPTTYEECLDEVIKNSKIDNAINLGIENCKLKFLNSKKLIVDCSVTWNGGQFVKGKPLNVSNYQQVDIINTTHEIFLPSNMDKETIHKTMKNNIEQLKKICPVK